MRSSYAGKQRAAAAVAAVGVVHGLDSGAAGTIVPSCVPVNSEAVFIKNGAMQ